MNKNFLLLIFLKSYKLLLLVSIISVKFKIANKNSWYSLYYGIIKLNTVFIFLEIKTNYLNHHFITLPESVKIFKLFWEIIMTKIQLE